LYNSGSWGAPPKAIRDKQREYQDECESETDIFIRYTYPSLLDESRKAVAKVLNAPVGSVVLVPNTTTAVNTVLRNLMWNQDGTDEILYFNTIYGACGKTIDYVCELNRDIVQSRVIHLQYPIEDLDYLELFRKAIKASRAAGKNPRIAIFDTVSAVPGVRVPFEGLTEICREEGVLSLIDGAHGIGHIHLDVTSGDPDFLATNCHKWLFVPRGCAVFYVAERNQHLIRSSLPTSHGFHPRPGIASALPNPLIKGPNSDFVENFAFVGTLDSLNYLTVPDAIKWRQEVCGGDEAIIKHNERLAHDGGKLVAEILGTKFLDNSTNTLTKCSLVNVLLPLKAAPSRTPGVNSVREEKMVEALFWIQKKLAEEYKTFFAIFYFQGELWVRISAQIYLDLDDFKWAGKTLKEMCDRAGKEDF
jgi:selenocysteine lyase/cysteine desulfurase